MAPSNSERDLFPRELKELDQWWQELIKDDWNLNQTLIGDYFSKLSSTEAKYNGFSVPEISGILSNRKSLAKVAKLKRLLIDTFKYDFASRTPHEGYENHYRQVIEFIKSTKKESSPILFHHQKSKENLDIAESFSGLYYCCAQYHNIDKLLPFLFYIRKDGSVELAGRDHYFKKGYIKVIGEKIYFSLDSQRAHEPELYITNIDPYFKNDIRYVTEFMMCGVWIDRKGLPAYGSCLLINQSDKLDSTILKRKNELSTTIQTMLTKQPALNRVEDRLFTLIEKEEEYLNVLTKLKKHNLSVYSLSFDQNVSYKPRNDSNDI